MCGLAGILSLSLSKESVLERLECMKDVIQHRGPDGQGTYLFTERAVLGLGHRRLAVFDPDHAMQPMSTMDKRYTLVFNGAIYNYHELKQALSQLGCHFQTNSDTEVLLKAYTIWGEDCVNHFQGMFAFAIWDKNENQLFCARDRIGIKPFYFFLTEDTFVFASEIKAIIASDLYQPTVNVDALHDYFTFQFCLNEKTLFKNVLKLEPGHVLKVQVMRESIAVNQYPYWDCVYDIENDRKESDYIEELQFLLNDAIKMHLRADVPVGAHLSGGLDSSTVATLASQHINHHLKTFTGKFEEGDEFDESQYAKILAQAIQADNYETTISDRDFELYLPKILWHMDEPMAGPGVIPQYFVSKLTSEHVKVALGGQGGDELYIGYARYLVATLENSLKQAIYQPNKSQQFALSDLEPNLQLLKQYQPMLQQFWQNGLFEEDEKRYFHLINRMHGMKQYLTIDSNLGYDTFIAFQSLFNKPTDSSLINQMSYFDLKASLPALLQVEDRTSMAHGLESRVPLLDHRLVDFVAKVPPSIKFKGGETKHLFKQAVKPLLPDAIFNRKDKMGFPVPVQHWFNGSVKPFIHDVLLSDKARQRGLYNTKQIEKHLAQTNCYNRVIWGLLNIELWHQIFIDTDSSWRATE